MLAFGRIIVWLILNSNFLIFWDWSRFWEWLLSFILWLMLIHRLVKKRWLTREDYINKKTYKLFFQAYQITTWIENHFMELDKIPETINKTKLAVFTSLIYSRESIGFKGMYFFTCTQVLNIAVSKLFRFLCWGFLRYLKFKIQMF